MEFNHYIALLDSIFDAKKNCIKIYGEQPQGIHLSRTDYRMLCVNWSGASPFVTFPRESIFGTDILSTNAIMTHIEGKFIKEKFYEDVY